MGFFTRKTRPATSRRSPAPAFRPRMEAMEDRSVPSAGWLITSSVTGTDPVMDIAQDAAGNTYATGHFSGTMTIGSTVLASDGTKQDLFVAKLDPTGNLLWASRFGGTGQDRGWGIDVASDGSVYVTGDFSGTMTAGASTLTSAGGADVFVLALDTAGAVRWARRCGTAAGNDKEAHIAVADDGSVYVTGVFNSESSVAATADFGTLTLTTDDADRDNFLAKLNGAGDFLWARQLDYGATPWDVLTEAGGDVFTVGGALARYDSSGNLLWSQERVENVGALYQDPTTGMDYLYTAELYSNSGGNGLLRKLDAVTGAAVWEKTILSPEEGHIFGVAADTNGNVYLTGGWLKEGGATDFDPGPGTFYLSRTSWYDIFLLKLDSGGNFVSARQMGGTGPYDTGYDVEVDAAGNVFMGGEWGGTAKFDLGDTTAVRTSSYSQGQGFILKMTQGLGAISGRVFADADANGVQGTDEPPVAGTTVYLDQNGNGSPDAGEVSVATDAYGGYLFAHLSAGTYTVRQVPPAGWASSGPAGGTHVVTLATDQFVGGRDFGAYRAPMTATYSNNTSRNIRDLQTATSTIVVSGGTSFIYDLDVRINVSHTNDADLDIFLFAPDGTRVELTTDNGGTGDHYTNTIFDDEAAVAITAGAAPFNGRYRPEALLSTHDGKNANGTWTLQIYDDTRKNTGTLLSWSLTIKGASGGSPLLAAGAPVAAAPTKSLTIGAVAPTLAEALARWEAAGVDTSALHGVDVRIADLGGTTLGMASGNTIWLDDNAASWGWFVDPTPHSDSEFTTPGNQGEQYRMDLLTVLEHELGHLLGHDHDEGGVMAETLSAGERWTPIGVYVDGPRLFAAPFGADEALDSVTGRRKGWQLVTPAGDGVAKTSDGDYIAKTGTLTFAPGETTKTITIEVKGDSKREADEDFYLDLYGISINGLFTKSRGLGTVLNDD